MLHKLRELLTEYYQYLCDNNEALGESDIVEARKIIEILRVVIQISSKPQLIRREDRSFEEQLLEFTQGT